MINIVFLKLYSDELNKFFEKQFAEQNSDQSQLQSIIKKDQTVVYSNANLTELLVGKDIAFSNCVTKIASLILSENWKYGIRLQRLNVVII